jgi:hypothetical protein
VLPVFGSDVFEGFEDSEDDLVSAVDLPSVVGFPSADDSAGFDARPLLPLESVA